ncbi:MAG: hypothetical protein ACT4PT_05220 [Methanobacteriota archaeon]
MEERTTLQLPRPLLAKIKGAGRKGQTYAQIINEALEALERQRFFDQQYRIYLDMKAGKEPWTEV